MLKPNFTGRSGSVPSQDTFFDSKILIVDDNPANVLLLRRIFEFSGYKNIQSVTDPTQVLTICQDWDPDLMILDLHMPQMSGHEVLAEIKQVRTDDDYFPILIFTADVTPEAKRKALEAGASDFLTKPGDATEILLRVGNFLRMRSLYHALSEQNHTLEDRVSERTYELHRAQVEVVERLALAAEYRDDETGHHAKRVGEMSAKIARQMGLSAEDCEVLELAATLHDLGKVGIPDGILLKKGRLDPDEFEVIKDHTIIGAKICAGSRSPILRAAEITAYSHHERWDGTGYPNGLKGEEIPLFGRICAVADVYDALRTERPYKPAVSHEEAMAEIERSAGTHFDPQVVEAIRAIMQEEESVEQAA